MARAVAVATRRVASIDLLDADDRGRARAWQFSVILEKAGHRWLRVPVPQLPAPPRKPTSLHLVEVWCRASTRTYVLEAQRVTRRPDGVWQFVVGAEVARRTAALARIVHAELRALGWRPDPRWPGLRRAGFPRGGLYGLGTHPLETPCVECTVEPRPGSIPGADVFWRVQRVSATGAVRSGKIEINIPGFGGFTAEFGPGPRPLRIARR
jgi:hypothetical protein